MATLISVINPAPPSLPLSPEAFSRLYQDQFSNVLRLYFNQLQAMSNNLIANQDVMQAEIERNQTLIWLDM